MTGNAQERKPTPAKKTSGERKVLKIPGYRLLSVAGRGGMGIVYRAVQESIGRQVAVKILPTATARNRQFVDRFLREAKAAAKLQHPNVVAAIDAGQAGPIVYFVMEYVEGETLAQRVARDGPLDLETTLTVLTSVAKALEHAETHNLVHRDVKPDNIMITTDSRVLLCDLGLARPPQSAGRKESKRTGIAEGTPAFMAPEQAQGLADVDIRADLYALGSTAYYLLFGHPPFDHEDAREIMRAHVYTPFPAFDAPHLDLPKPFVKLLSDLVEKDRAKRCPTPTALLQSLERISNTSQRLTVPATPQTRRLRRWQLGVSIVAVLVALAFIAATLSPGPSPQPSPEDPSTIPAPVAQPKTASAPPKELHNAQALREAEASTRLRLITSSRREDAETISALEQLAHAFSGTAAAKEAVQMAKAIETALADRRQALTDQIASALALATDNQDYARAYEVLASLKARAAEHAMTGEWEAADKRARKHVGKTWHTLRAHVLQLAQQNLFRQALNELAAFADKAPADLGEQVGIVETAVVNLEAAAKKKRMGKVVWEDVVGLLKARKFSAARDHLLACIEDPALVSERAECQKLAAELTLAEQAKKGLSERLSTALQKSKLTIPHLSGTPLQIRGGTLDPSTLAMTLRERGSKEPYQLLLNETASPFALELVGPASGEPALGLGLFLLLWDVPEQAMVILEKAKAQGVGFSAVIKRYMVGAASRQLEWGAYARMQRAQRLLATGEVDVANQMLQPLSDTYRKTAFVKDQLATIKAVFTDARTLLYLQDPERLFAGEIEISSQHRFLAQYSFASAEELADWTPDTVLGGKESRVHSEAPGLARFSGRVRWRAAVKDDLSIEALVDRPRTVKNIAFLLYERGLWDGWFCGLRVDKFGGPDFFHVSPQAPTTPGKRVAYPAHMVARLGGSITNTEILFGSTRPPVGLSQSRLRIDVRRSTLTMRLGRTLVSSQIPIARSDMSGTVAIWPRGETLRLRELKISGSLDSAWLQKAARASARKEVEALF